MEGRRLIPIPNDYLEDNEFLGPLTDEVLADIVAECCIVRGDPYFYVRMLERQWKDYERWLGHGVPERLHAWGSALRQLRE